MSDEVKPERYWPRRRMRPWELVVAACCIFLLEGIIFPNFIRAGGVSRDPVLMTITGVFVGLVMLCFVRCPWRQWMAKLVLGAVVCFSLAMFGAVLLPRRHGGNPTNACIANLKQIEGAKANWALEEHKTTNDIPVAADLYGGDRYIRVEPKCPKGGVYIIGRVGEPPRCNIESHSL